MDALPWDAIVKGLLGVLVLVGSFFGIRAIGSSQERRKQAEKGLQDARDAEKITHRTLPTDDDGIRKLLRKR